MATWGDEPQPGDQGQSAGQGPPPDPRPQWGDPNPYPGQPHQQQQEPPPPWSPTGAPQQPPPPQQRPPPQQPPPQPPPPQPPPWQQTAASPQQQWQPGPPAAPQNDWRQAQHSWAPSQTAPPPAPPRQHQQKLWPAFMVIALLAAAAGATYWFVVREDEPSFPDAWDAKVTDLVAFVEDERNLAFEHPVEVRYLDDAAWTEEMTTDPAMVTDEDRADADDSIGLLRAMGLVSGDVDLFEEADEFAVSNVLAFYDYDNKSITVHADANAELSLGVRGTLVHELTHVIQDQNYDLNAMSEASGDDSIVFDALTEGDAVNVENAWYETLSDDDKAAYDAESDDVGEEAQAADVPEALRTLMGVPYAMGPPFAAALAADGASTFNDAFEDPPSDDEAVFSPERHIDGDTREIVAKPDVPDDAEEIEDGQFGPVAWYIMLSERINAHQAFAAVRGFGGDYYAQYELDGKQCIRVRIQGESELETAAMKGAIEAWIGSLPTPFATLDDEGDTLLFESCDPGGGVDLATGKSADALVLPVLHAYGVLGVLGEGGSVKEAECYANGITDGIPEEALSIDEEPANIDQIAAAAAQACF